MIYLLVLSQDLPKVIRDNVVSFDEYNVVCPRVLGGDVPKVVNREQLYFLLDDLSLHGSGKKK